MTWRVDYPFSLLSTSIALNWSQQELPQPYLNDPYLGIQRAFPYRSFALEKGFSLPASNALPRICPINSQPLSALQGVWD